MDIIKSTVSILKRLFSDCHLSQGIGMPLILDSTAGLLNVTLAGAPCNATPPLTEAEMRREYMGCQNLPTALWYQNRRGRPLDRKN